jgi:competence protein ComEA
MENWKDLLAFNRSERRGIWVLVLIILCLTGIDVVISNKKQSHDPVEITRIMSDSRKGFDVFRMKNSKGGKFQNRSKPVNDSLFFFDPNKLDTSGWVMLGLSAKQAAVITSYTRKGGRFRSKDDLKRSFVITEKFYSRVEPWIRISPGEVPSEKSGQSDRGLQSTICINTADTSELRKLKGIGTVLAGRIFNYRESLGGFHRTEQLLEVYGLSPEVFEQNRHRMSIRAPGLKYIHINEASPKVLDSHPYVSKKLTWVITTLRSESPIRSREDLMQRLPSGVSIPDHLWPYLVF